MENLSAAETAAGAVAPACAIPGRKNRRKKDKNKNPGDRVSKELLLCLPDFYFIGNGSIPPQAEFLLVKAE